MKRCWPTATGCSSDCPGGPTGTVTLPTNGSAMDISGQGGITYITSANGAQIYTYSTCNQTLAQMFAATAPTLIKALPNGTGAVAADSPDIDLVSTPPTLSAGCPITSEEHDHVLRPWRREIFTAQQFAGKLRCQSRVHRQ